MPDFEKKSFSLPMNSGSGISEEERAENWKRIFGEPCPARHHTGIECKLKKHHEGLHTDGVVTWEEK